MVIWNSLRSYIGSLLAVVAAEFAARMLSTQIGAQPLSLFLVLAIIVSGLYLGRGPGLFASIVSFIVWVRDYQHPDGVYIATEILVLAVFITIAVLTASVSAKFKEKASQAVAQEADIALLFEASETISREMDLTGAIGTLSDVLRGLCHIPNCLVWKTLSGENPELSLVGESERVFTVDESITSFAMKSAENRTVIGFENSGDAIPRKGAFVPLTANGKLLGVLFVAGRDDQKQFSDIDQRLILTLANHLAFVLARDSLSRQASLAEALRESDILKDAIISLVSHELNTPLAAIKAIASAGEMIGSSQDALRSIILEADRLSDILNNLLDLSRLEAGAWRSEKDWCDISEIVATCLDRLPDENASRVKVTIEQDLPLVCTDYTQAALALSNLLQNAVKYSPKNSHVEIIATAEHNGSDERPSGILLRVRDYGKGIPTADLERVFERFYRSNEHKSSGISGTGLGLALVKAIMDAQGGKVWAMNAPKGEHSGAVFTISLPVE